MDLYKRYLNRVNSVIQLSVIYFSISSSFIQALDARSYNKLFNDDNDNIDFNNINFNNDNIDLNETVSNEFNKYTKQFEHTSKLSIVTLSISTYSALIIAAERHFGLQQRETNVERLKDLYTEPISRIKTILELLRPWMYISYYTTSKQVEDDEIKDDKIKNDNKKINRYNHNHNHNHNHNYDYDYEYELNRNKNNETTEVFDEEKKKDWIAMMDKIDKEYTHIIDIKKELDNSLEKMINVTTLKKYQVIVPRKRRFTNLNFSRRYKEEEENYHIHRSFREKLCDKILFLCRRQTHKHPFAYDEEDLNNFENNDSINKINKINHYI